MSALPALICDGFAPVAQRAPRRQWLRQLQMHQFRVRGQIRRRYMEAPAHCGSIR